VPWQWGEAEQRAFEILKESLSTAPILRYPDISREYYIYCDACNYGVGAMLTQRLPRLNPVNIGSTEIENDKEDEPQEDEYVIAYTSKHLTDAQAAWSTTEKECYAIVHTVKTFFHYLFNGDCTV